MLLRYILLFFSALVAFSTIGSDSIRLSTAYMDQLGEKYGQAARQRLQAWQDLLDDLAQSPEQVKLKEVNDFFNQNVRFLDDIVHWKLKDYWATPVEFLVSHAGDCEDFSIAKYYTLKELGIPIEKMSVTYVKALEYNQAHMVLTYYPTPNAIPLVLDNLINEIKPANERRDLLHVFSFNGDSLWLSKKGKRAELVGTSDRLAHWVKVKERIDTKTVNVQ